jgi:hypothetical protein
MALDWDWADAFLKGGRKKYERPLYDRGLRIYKTNKWDADSDINISWSWNMSTPFVTYHKNGTTTINGPIYPHGWPTLRSQSVRLTIQRYAGIKVFQRNYKFYLEEKGAPLGPAKIQGCRMCKQSGRLDSWCHPSTCWDGNSSTTNLCPTHPDATLRVGKSWHYVPCEHGNTDGHTVVKGQECYSCGGTKKRDYGSKPERTQWTGTPLRLRDGKIIKSAATLLERMVADYVEPIG